MTNNPVSRKLISLVTAVLTMAVMCGMPAVAFAADSGVTKEETVYVVTDSTGAQTDVIVSDHLMNKGKSKTISDETTLSDIENVKGEETFSQNGDDLTWDAEGNSIYYQGTTTEEVPVTMDVTYRLDGKTVSGSELQGKSGKAEITIRYENSAEYNGTTVPFIVLTGMVVTDESFKNVKISKGKVIDDGDKLMIVGMAAPGLAQTLGMGESELGIGSSVTITGDADKFAVEDMMTVVTNAFFEDIDSGGIDLEYDDQIAALNKGSKQLVDGSAKLYDGLNKLNGKMPGLKSGIGDLKEGADKLNKGTKDAQEGATALNTGIQMLKDLPDELSVMVQKLQQMKGVADTLYASMGSIQSGIDTAVAALNSASTSQQDVINYLKDLRTKYNKLDATQKAKVNAILGGDTKSDLDTVIAEAEGVKTTIDVTANGSTDLGKKGLKDISDNIGSASTQGSALFYMNLLSSGLGQMETTVSEKQTALSQGVPKLVGGAQKLKDGEDQLATGAQALANGMNSLNDKSGSLIDGVKQLDAGSLKLSNGMSKLYREGIRKIVDMYNNDLKGTLNSVDGMLDAGKGYKSFTRLPSGMDGNVKFIYKTDMTN